MYRAGDLPARYFKNNKMKWIFIAICIMWTFPSLSQNTISRIIDLDDKAIRNGVEDLEILNGFIYT